MVSSRWESAGSVLCAWSFGTSVTEGSAGEVSQKATASTGRLVRLVSLAVVMSLLAASLVTGLTTPAAAASGFNPVFTTNAPGNITFLSNTLMTCNSATGTCVSNGQNGTWANNNFTMAEVDVDTDRRRATGFD